MAELNPIDLESFTQGRLNKNDYETKRVLEAALQEVRSYCKWNVSPVQTVTMTLDGPGEWGGMSVGMGSLYGGSYYTGTGTLRQQRVGGNTLWLPTKRLTAVNSVVEDGVTLDVTTLQFSDTGAVVKTPITPINSGTTSSSWSVNYQGLVVNFTHGWSETEASDWRRIVLMIADRMSIVRGPIGAFPTDVGPYRMGAWYGTSRTGNLAVQAGWLDDLLGMIDTARYVRIAV